MRIGRLLSALALWCSTCSLVAAEAPSTVADDYVAIAQPLLQKYCHDCHAGEVTEAELDLAAFATDADVRKQPAVWVQIRDVLTTGDMPPKAAKQPSDAQRAQLLAWVRAMLAEEARKHAGDPGPVGLRRLDNSEYNYVLRDLTGLPSLDLTHEFPVDGAAGEGFTNVSSGQGMSPAMVQKYLDAAKRAAEHLELLPDGVRFSAATTQRDRTDEHLARIQAFYRRFTADGGGTAVNLQGVKFETNQGGVLPVERYLQATLEQREALQAGRTTVDAVAVERGLNPRYLAALWKVLSTDAAANGSQLGWLRSRWRQAGPGEAAAVAQWLAAGQEALWKFNPVGQIAPGGQPRRWMEPVSPLVGSRELRVELPAAADDVPLTLAAHDLADGAEHDIVLWERPRIEFTALQGEPPIPPVLLRDLRILTQRSRGLQATELPRTVEYLQALATAHRESKALPELAADLNLHPELLARWAAFTGIAGGGPPRIAGLFTQKNAQLHGYQALNGWGLAETPSLLANSSDEPIAISTLTVPPQGVTLHPSPTLEAFIAWRSPAAATFRLEGLVADADDKCGNGAAWRVEHHQPGTITTLAEGVIDNGGRAEIKPDVTLTVQAGDVIVLAIGPRDGNHTCDTTHVEFRLTAIEGEGRSWNLASEVVGRILEGNPLADAQGHPEVWHFGSRPLQAGGPSVLPAETAIARWRAAVTARDDAAASVTAAQLVEFLTTSTAEAIALPDQALRESLRSWTGPLRWITVAQQSEMIETDTTDDTTIGLDPARFGATPRGAAIDQADLCLPAPQRIELRIPRELCSRAALVTTAKLHSESGGEGSVQVTAAIGAAGDAGPWIGGPILIEPNSPAAQRWTESTAAFRDLLPRALCYARIVPVDEVVTLTLFFREDDHLRRLMLDDAQAAELDRLWDELLFVSEEPLKLVVALEQIREFATQDRPDLVTVFDPLKEPVGRRAEEFRQRQLAAEPRQLEAVIALADGAWRRPLSTAERETLQAFYTRLRGDEIPHAEAIRLTFARILTSAAFLFKVEQAPAGVAAAPVTDRELASRLSFFLWSSVPDASLLSAAEAGQLHDDAVLIDQTRRMLRDARVRRLAMHFACQWLHVRDFATAEEKNERLFPEFAGLRDSMAEEAVLFFEDLFRNDRSVLDILRADATFVNSELAAHYGVGDWPSAAATDGEPVIGGPEWRRVTGLRRGDRGGILGMASVLASQSGASRTSPILRGNWVYETVLGEKLPKPPPGVPQLPETVPSGLTERQLIEQHSSVDACARCHVKIDPYGFALEQFDAIGRRRPQLVNTRTVAADGTALEGLAGLREYLLTTRRDDFVRQFCRKLLGYALGREVQLSDEPLLDGMQSRLQAGDYRVSIAVEAIVTSPQFRRIRGADADGGE
jgi:mono/diheme cytochrome c family protein